MLSKILQIDMANYKILFNLKIFPYIITLLLINIKFAKCSVGESNLKSTNDGYDENIFKEHHERILQLMDSSNIKANARHFSKFPHEPGSKRNEKLAIEMKIKWKEFGFDKTEIFKYKALISFPEKPAEIELIKNSKSYKKLTVTNEPAYGSSERNGKAVYPFNAYSPSGIVTGEYVFVNYGEEKDYKTLQKMGVALKHKIFIIRYGTGHPRSHLLADAQKLGAIGVLFFSDPKDYTNPGQEYPKGWMLNKYGVQRGSIYALSGDALSQGYPSKDHYYRDDISSYKSSIKIPSQPISASFAEELFRFMNDSSYLLPSTFEGGMNLTYMLQSGKNRKLSLKVSNKMEDKYTSVVCGSLYGSKVPDRYVLIGNHRDAWTYGAADPVSGTAVMNEIVRVLGKYKTETQYRPQRSIMVCSWGAEEAGMLGSTEWADENARFLSNQVIAYLNVDMAVEGNFTLQIKSLNHMVKSIFQAAKSVQSPSTPNISLFDDMCHKHALLMKRKSDLKQPTYDSPGAVSDFDHITHRYGVTVSDYRYIYNKLDFPQLSAHNGHYHTLYDSFDWMSKFIDPSFKYHLVLGKLWLMHTLILTDSIIIPFDLKGFAQQIQNEFIEFEKTHRSALDKYHISLDFAKKRIKELILQATQFQKYIEEISLQELSPNQIRAINDKIVNFEKNFILDTDVGISKLKHIIYSVYGTFHGISEALSQKLGRKGDVARREITLLVWCIDMAIRSLDLSELMIRNINQQL